jgi:hypothetical protein
MPCSARTLIPTLLFATIFSCAGRAGAVQVEITPDGYSIEQIELLKAVALESPELLGRIGSHRFRILETHEASNQAPKEQDLEPGDVRFIGYDYDSNQTIDIRMARGAVIVEAAETLGHVDPPYPSPEEVEEAIALVRKDPYFGPLARDWRPYEAMPPLVTISAELGFAASGNFPHGPFVSHGLAAPGDRIVSIGLLPENSAPDSLQHEIVGVNLSRGTIVRFPAGAPPTALVAPRVCAPRNAGQANTARGVAGSATLDIRDDAGNVLWNFQVLRPAVSSGTRGSGLDLRKIRYQGKLVASQIHTPIVNVQYARNICGPYRDWQYSENPFQAKGTLIAPGILRAEGRPTTILESYRDAGNFRGVAISTEGEVTRLVTEVAAGWYRYQVEYLFYPNGRIEPRWGFAAIQDSCTCNLHFHNAYWRMDFDLDETSGDRVEIGNGTQWKLLEREARLLRRPGQEQLRVLNLKSGMQAIIEPGARDGTADLFGKGDAWVLHRRDGQLDDARLTRFAAIGIDGYVANDPVVDEDIVVWYGAHFRHDSDDDSGASHILGPTIRVIAPRDPSPEERPARD